MFTLLLPLVLEFNGGVAGNSRDVPLPDEGLMFPIVLLVLMLVC